MPRLVNGISARVTHLHQLVHVSNVIDRFKTLMVRAIMVFAYACVPLFQGNITTIRAIALVLSDILNTRTDFIWLQENS